MVTTKNYIRPELSPCKYMKLSSFDLKLSTQKNHIYSNMEGNHKSANSVFKFTLNEARSLCMEGEPFSRNNKREREMEGSQIAVFPRPLFCCGRSNHKSLLGAPLGRTHTFLPHFKKWFRIH